MAKTFGHRVFTGGVTLFMVGTSNQSVPEMAIEYNKYIKTMS